MRMVSNIFVYEANAKHSLPEGQERRLISQRISPREIPEGGIICYACWVRARRMLQEQPEVPPLENLNRHVVQRQEIEGVDYSNICLWCLCSLSLRGRRHILSDGAERNEIITRIYPRVIPSHGHVCNACWVSARRHVQRAATIDERQDLVASHSRRHINDVCALCSTSLFRRHTHAVTTAAVRLEIAARIHPRELPEHALLCTTCWTQIVQVQDVHVHEQEPREPTMELDEYTHTTSSSNCCFVPLCTHTERLCVPDYLRKRILVSQKVFITSSARVCSEHKSLYNWEFLDQYDFSNTFTKSEMQAMLNLSTQEIFQYFDFENINGIDDNIVQFWTGLNKEKYFNIFMSELIIFALGVYQIKQAKSYYGEHVRQRGSFQVEISEHLEAVSTTTTSQQNPLLIRGRIKSRHQSGRTYYTYILVASQGTSWDDRIKGYYCSCIAGQRTVGCCAHIMTIVWYLGWARHQDNIAAPASFLDDILIVRDDVENE